MEEKKVLFLEKRGCDFLKSDTRCVRSNVGNYRVCTTDYCINAKNGNKYFIEFSLFTKSHFRHTNKRTGEPLKKPVYVLDNDCALYCDLSYQDENGFTWGDYETCKASTNAGLDYTIENILAFVNAISVDQYSAIEFV